MGNLILQMGISLDELVARPGKYGAVGWGTPPEDSALKQRLGTITRAARPDRRVPARASPGCARRRPVPLQGLAAPLNLNLVEAETYDSGLTLLVYRPALAKRQIEGG